MADNQDLPGVVHPPVVEHVTEAVSPYLLYASDNPGAVITSVLLNGENYNEWSREMLNALQAKRKTMFINETLVKPAETSANYDNWMTVNSMLVGWIRSSIEPKIRATITYVLDALQLWKDLKQRFSVGNKVRIHHVKTHISACRQDGQTVLEYFGRLSKLWDELQTLRPLPLCTCGAALEILQEKEEEKVHQFVMGLDEARFGGICTAIIDRDLIPSIGEVYQKLVREEKRLDMSRTRDVRQEVVGFVARQGTAVTPRTDGVLHGLMLTEGSGSKPRDRNVVCTHCNKTGHEKVECGQIVGFPDWWYERGNNAGLGRGWGGRSNGSGRGKKSSECGTLNTDSFNGRINSYSGVVASDPTID